MSIVPQLVFNLTTYLFAGSSPLFGLGTRWAPFGAGARAAAHLTAEDLEADAVTGEDCPSIAAVVAVCVLPPVDPQAVNASPVIAVAEQHSARRAARERTNIGAA
jgi:hypothetical protein